MPFCTTCGTSNEDSATFCANCGSNMKGANQQTAKSAPMLQSDQDSYLEKNPQYPQQQGYPPQQYGYQPGGQGFKPPRTGWLTFVIVMNWISIFGVVAGGLFVMAFFSLFNVPQSFFLIVGIGVFLIAGVIYWLIKELNNYNNTARIIQIILAVLGLLGALGDISSGFINLAISGLMIYGLGFDKETVALFKPEQRFMH